MIMRVLIAYESLYGTLRESLADLRLTGPGQRAAAWGAELTELVRRA